ncbi:hypothetical protein SAMN04488238_102150 [Roseicitreum antarcticum]|uniref:Uncharacterized protein n=1 Tax=Roseicitreum antarcticum TaxID=564137 RepID=A0A1H2TS17_9RHOB|nr:hypothetical protein SAMN04488238_102150 [Roseicitreum antarcticum]
MQHAPDPRIRLTCPLERTCSVPTPHAIRAAAVQLAGLFPASRLTLLTETAP